MFKMSRAGLLCGAAAVACCLLIIDSIPLRVVGASSDSEDAAEEFWEQFIQQSYPGSTKSFTPLEKSLLATFTKDRRQARAVKHAGISAGAGGGLLALLTPLLALKGHVNAERAGRVPMDSYTKEPLEAETQSLPAGKEGGGRLAKVKKFFTPKSFNWSKGATAAGVLGGVMLVGAMALLVASQMKMKKIKEDRRKFRTLLARQRKEMEEAGSAGGGVGVEGQEGSENDGWQTTIPEIIEAIAAAGKAAAAPDTPPPSP